MYTSYQKNSKGVYNVNQKIIIDLLKQGNLTIPTILFEQYHYLGLDETEFLTLLHIYHFVEKGNLFPTPEEIITKMSISSEKCTEILSNLLRRGFLSIQQIEESHVISECYTFDLLWEKLAQLIIRENQITQKKEVPEESLYTVFEKEFGRPLSPFECETLVMWEEQENHTPILIKSALREAVISGKLNFRYIDRILFEWKKNGIKTVEQAKQQGKKFRQSKSSTQQQANTHKGGTVPFYNWLEQ